MMPIVFAEHRKSLVNEPIIIPEIVTIRWQEAIAEPNMMRWHSIAQMLSSMFINSSLYAPGSPITNDLRTLADIAYQHARSMEPAREVA